jgi:putative transposase
MGSAGDAYDNALAGSFVDSLKTELITDRIWRSRSQLELGVVTYLSWFNNDRLHESLGDIPPVEFELAAPAPLAYGLAALGGANPDYADRCA